jgi:hypothetical protein
MHTFFSQAHGKIIFSRHPVIFLHDPGTSVCEENTGPFNQTVHYRPNNARQYTGISILSVSGGGVADVTGSWFCGI